MTSTKAPFLLYRLAISEICVALVTLIFGALVTTRHAGMAFPDWPTSDGYLMVTYPWLKDYAVNWNKFLEHGHRLAGMWIGLWSIGLVVCTFWLDRRKWVRGLALGILLGVICQGILGGFRVQLNDRGLAMLHGIFAGIVFSLMGTLAAVTSAGWADAAVRPTSRQTGKFQGMAIILLTTLVVQYVFGSLIRHQGRGLHEHLGLGILSLVIVIVNFIVARSAESRWVRRAALLLLLIAFGQVGLGLGTWVVKFGLAQVGYVAVANSLQQVLLRTAHMVWGVVTLMTAVVYLVKVFRVAAVSPRSAEPVLELRRPASFAQSGGTR